MNAARACAYCERTGQQMEPCCDRPEHADRLVCAGVHGCMGVILGVLHEQEAPKADDGRRLAAIRAVFEVFDWSTDDRQYALEEIERIVMGDDE